jgi:plasmid stabilization system protein ParE
MAEIRWTHEAENWLKDIFDYIAEDNPDAAAKTVNGIYQRVQELSQFPEMGHSYKHGSGRPVRILLYGHYRIAYSVRLVEISIFWVFFMGLSIFNGICSD